MTATITDYRDHIEGKYNESYQKLNVGNIVPFEVKVIEAVINDDFSTIDLRKCRNALSHEPFLLDDDFVKQYEGKEPEWGELGWFTFKRTYARKVERPDGTSIRTEEWTEVVRRVVEGNLSLIPNDPVVTQEYGKTIFHQIWNLIWTPSGRGLWMSGTEFAKRSGDALVNCWFIQTRPWHYGPTNKIFTRYKIDPYEKKVSFPFVFLFDQAMKGGGVGFSVEQDVIENIPEPKNHVNVYFKIDESHPDYEQVKEMANNLGAPLNKRYVGAIMSVLQLSVADSREGWCEALAMVIDEHYRKDEKDVIIVIDLSEIRCKGTPIRGFGGVASGPAPLLELLWFYNTTFNKFVGKKLTSVVCTDLHNATGRCVVAGNVRRTAEIGLSDPYDAEFVDMKNYKLYEWVNGKSDEDLLGEGYTWDEINDARYQEWAQNNHRWASNNSVVIDDPRSYDFGFISPRIEVNGEPGAYIRWLAQNFGRIIDGYREQIDKAVGANPCAEISLESGEPCNLVELFLPVMYKMGLDPAEVLPYMVHYAKRVTFAQYEWEISREVIQRNRRLGVSISGFVDWVLMKYGKGAIRGWKVYQKEDWHDMIWLTDDADYTYHKGTIPPKYYPDTEVCEPDYNPELVAELDRMYKIVVQADLEYSALLTKTLGYTVNPSIKRTTVKPSGTVSLLPFVSPGVHHHYFRYGIRRIRVQENDPLLKLVQMCGYYTEPALHNPGSYVIEFPVKAPTVDYEDFRSCEEITIEEQFAMQALLAVYWADNMVSCTITFHEHERHKIKNLLEQYRMRIKSTSLLPYSEHGYVQSPYEAKTKEWYEETTKNIIYKPHDLYHELMGSGQFQDWEMTMEDALECMTGGCPVR